MKQLKTYQIKIKHNKITLHKDIYNFLTREDAQLYSLGLCEGLRLGGMNPSKTTIKELV